MNNKIIKALAVQERLNRYFAQFNPSCDACRAGDMIRENKRIYNAYRWSVQEKSEQANAFGWWTVETARDKAKAMTKVELRQIAKI